MTRIILVLLILKLLIASIFAASPLSLQESIELALENNKEILAEEKGYEAAHWSQYNVFSNFLPQASFNATAVRIDDKTYEQATEVHRIPVFGPNNLPTGDYIPFSAAAMNGINRTTYRTNFTVQQPVFTGGRIYRGYQIARLARRQAEKTLADRKNDVGYRVTDTYFNILQLQDLQETVSRNIAAAEANLRNVSQMKDIGMARRSDVLQWQVRLQEYQTTRRELEYGIEVLLEYWNNLLGFSGILYHPEGIDPVDYDREIEYYATLEPAEIDDFTESNLRALREHNPQMHNIGITREMVQRNYQIARGNFLPTLNLQFNYELENDDKLDLSGERNWNLVAMLSFPLFRGGANYTNLRKARSEKRQTEYATSAMEDLLMTETRRVSRQLITSALQVESNRTALEYARENYEILQNLFQQGMLTSSEFLDAETMLFAAEANVISAYYDFIITSYELNKYTTLKGVK